MNICITQGMSELMLFIEVCHGQRQWLRFEKVLRVDTKLRTE